MDSLTLNGTLRSYSLNVAGFVNHPLLSSKLLLSLHYSH